MINCGPCSECCKGPRELVIKERDDLQTFFDGEIKLAQKENGDCIYLNENCSIYEKRPDECRSFDCREHIETVPGRVKIEALKRWRS